MKFKINRDHFSNGLAQVLNVVGSKATMPILSNVLIEADKDQISLTTTNLDLGIRCRIKADVKEAGAITLPVKKLASIIRELPSTDVSIDTSPAHQAKVTSGGSQFKIMGMGKEEFPGLPEFEDEKAFMLEQLDFAQMLKHVSYAQSNDETRYILNGVYINFKEGRLTLVATDGRRLAKVEKATEVPEKSTGSIILPAKTVAELVRLLDKGEKVQVSFNERRASFQIGTEKASESGLSDQVYLFSKVVDGNYPNYSQVIPKETAQRIKLDRELFLQCVHRAALVTTDKANAVKIKLGSNQLEISASSPDFGESHESMGVEYSGPDLQVAFNPAFVMDPLRALTTNEVFLELKDEVSPGVFKTLDTSFVCVIMPVRIS
ncbi:MAG TPA: DNA polymerase III subunit beta [Opitutaceae bacterium]|nr:DNA polymerase III subunit beta [Opitutaceae bacterium]